MLIKRKTKLVVTASTVASLLITVNSPASAVSLGVTGVVTDKAGLVIEGEDVEVKFTAMVENPVQTLSALDTSTSGTLGEISFSISNLGGSTRSASSASATLQGGAFFRVNNQDVSQISLTGSAGGRVFRALNQQIVIPEPLTILGSGVALGFGAYFKKTYSKKQKKVKTKA